MNMKEFDRNIRDETIDKQFTLVTHNFSYEIYHIRIVTYAVHADFAPRNRWSISLYDEHGECISTPTVNLHHVPTDIDMNEDSNRHTFIKNYNEGVGVTDALVKAGIVRDTGKRVQMGFGSTVAYVEVLI